MGGHYDKHCFHIAQHKHSVLGTFYNLTQTNLAS